MQDGGELAFQVGQQGDAAAELLQSLQIPYLRAEVLLAQLQAVQPAANGQEHHSRRHVERDRNPVIGVLHAEAAGLEPEHGIDETHHQDDERRPPPEPRRGDPDRRKEKGEEGKSAGNQERPHRPLQRHGKQQQAHGNRSGAAPGRPEWAAHSHSDVADCAAFQAECTGSEDIRGSAMRASSSSTAASAAGLVRWWSKPALRERARSSFAPQPVSATSTVLARVGDARSSPGHLVAVLARHADVQEDDVRVELMGDAHCLVARRWPRGSRGRSVPAAPPGSRPHRRCRPPPAPGEMARLSAVPAGRAGARAAWAASASGSRTVKVLPSPLPGLSAVTAAAVQLDQAAHQRQADAQAAL